MKEKMKDSGIPWIGQIPEDWEVCKVKNFFIYKKRIVGDDAENWQRLALTLNGVIKRSKDDSEGLQPEKFEGYQILMQNELVFKLIDLNNIQTSRVGLSNYDGIVSPAYIILSPQNISVLFSYYYFISLYYRNIFNTLGDDGVRSSLNSLDLLNLKIVVPPQEIQQKIVEILDKKCGQIDELVSLEENEIEKLKEYKTSLITKVVTKGLDHNAKMKDSGIPWIGQIPESWITIKIKFTSWLKGRIGWDGLKSSEFKEDGPFLITGTDFNNGNIKWDTCAHITEERFMEDELLHVKEGDLLITKDGTIGKLAIVKNCPEKVSLNSGVMIIRNNSNWKYDNKYLYYILLSNQFYLWYEKSQNGNSTIKHLYQEQFYNFEFSYPNILYQKRIVAYLDNKCEEIDNLIKIKQEKIEKLKEYKKSLIYQYVTGKKEVV